MAGSGVATSPTICSARGSLTSAGATCRLMTMPLRPGSAGTVPSAISLFTGALARQLEIGEQLLDELQRADGDRPRRRC